MVEAHALIAQLVERLDRRCEDYLRVAGNYEKGSEFNTSFTARAAETQVVATDLYLLLDRLGAKDGAST